MNDQGEPIEKNRALPKEIEGTLTKNEITIQNEGNSMNSYMKIAECGSKYIKLIKEENSTK